ncbi:hypothetical protein [Streptomyces virginiae]|uniref:Uncharacterized protein n=1 Tax=Streptomyces virginiae TaxID=1961 RepID=A0ABZ1T468_STRVG|nr:hypothetical protein [Streptomyces virginiae]WTB20317.1 hypothetical protein OG253_01730 [Streptomyces virginiae]
MDTFADRFDAGWTWWEAAIEEAQEGRWIRTQRNGKPSRTSAPPQTLAGILTWAAR